MTQAHCGTLLLLTVAASVKTAQKQIQTLEDEAFRIRSGRLYRIRRDIVSIPVICQFQKTRLQRFAAAVIYVQIGLYIFFFHLPMA